MFEQEALQRMSGGRGGLMVSAEAVRPFVVVTANTQAQVTEIYFKDDVDDSEPPEPVNRVTDLGLDLAPLEAGIPFFCPEGKVFSKIVISSGVVIIH